MSRDTRRAIAQLLDRYGTSYAAQAGITLRNKPSPLFRLLTLALLLSVRIRADIAVDAARELSRAGWRTPAKLQAATWQERVDALGRAHYKRYDESTSTYLGQLATRTLERWHGDLRRLRAEAAGDASAIRRLLGEFDRIGPTGTDVFCREAQAVWPELQPYFDARALRSAAELGLPRDPAALAELVPARDVARFAAALVRSSLERR